MASSGPDWNQPSGTPPSYPPPYTPAPVGGGLAPNIAGAISYITIIPAIIFLVLAPYNRDRFVRFHAWQSLILWIVAFLIRIVLAFLPFIGWIAYDIFNLLVLIAAIIAALQAFQGKEWKIPVIGDMAAQQAGRGLV